MNLASTYREKSEVAKTHLHEMAKRVNLLVGLRVLIFGLLIFAVYIFWGNVILETLSILLLGLSFGYVIKAHSNVNAKRQYWDAIYTFYLNELKALDNDYSWANNGTEYKIPYHEYANDIDLFGHLSFFHKINRTSTLGGESALASKLSANDCTDILQKQAAVKELSEKMEFLERFVGTAKTNKSDIKPEILKNWFKDYPIAMSKKIKPLLWSFPIVSGVVFSLYLFNMLDGVFFGAWFAFGLFMTGILIKNTIKFNTEINKIAENIKTFGNLLTLIESEKFQSELLQNIQRNIHQQDHKASEMLRTFTRKVDLFNNRNNFLVGIFGNALLLWDSQTIFGVERWIENNRNTVQNWIDGIFEFDAYLSLALFKFNHPTFEFPHLLDVNANVILEGKSMGHPLLNKSVCVTNDVTILDENFLIITGANMAGKSTFLRTVALSIVMTNVGLPLFASEIKIKPQRLITSMRTEDSLKDDESYFFAELKRLKYIIESINVSKHFIILDEILKGTNSKDKEEGSKQFVQKLVRLKASGIIATHDLGLCTISEEIPQVKNFYYDAEIVNDELYFDYKMKNGVCKNMNASFLLKKMEIV